MNCNDISAELEAYFDGAVSGSLKREIEAHLLVCSSCDSSLKELQGMRSLLERDHIPAPAALLDERVMQAFRDRSPRRVEVSRWLNVITGSIRIPKPLVATAVAVLALASFVSFQAGKRTADRIVITTAPANATTPTGTPSSKVTQPDSDLPDERQSRMALSDHQSRRAVRTAREQRLSRRSVVSLDSLTMVSRSGTNYSTRAALDGFEPLADANVRVVRTLEQK